MEQPFTICELNENQKGIYQWRKRGRKFDRNWSDRGGKAKRRTRIAARSRRRKTLGMCKHRRDIFDREMTWGKRSHRGGGCRRDRKRNHSDGLRSMLRCDGRVTLALATLAVILTLAPLYGRRRLRKQGRRWRRRRGT